MGAGGGGWRRRGWGAGILPPARLGVASRCRTAQVAAQGATNAALTSRSSVCVVWMYQIPIAVIPVTPQKISQGLLAAIEVLQQVRALHSAQERLHTIANEVVSCSFEM